MIRSSSKRSTRSTARHSSARLADDVELDDATGLERVKEEDDSTEYDGLKLNGPLSPSTMSAEPTNGNEDIPTPRPSTDAQQHRVTTTTRSSAFIEDLPPQTTPLPTPRPAYTTRASSFRSSMSDPFGDKHGALDATPDAARPRPRARDHSHARSEEDDDRLPATPTDDRFRYGGASQALVGDAAAAEDELDERGVMSVWDWLLCGCWGRPIGYEDQEARTNPME